MRRQIVSVTILEIFAVKLFMTLTLTLRLGQRSMWIYRSKGSMRLSICLYDLLPFCEIFSVEMCMTLTFTFTMTFDKMSRFARLSLWPYQCTRFDSLNLKKIKYVVVIDQNCQHSFVRKDLLFVVQQFDRSTSVLSQYSSLIAVQQFDRSPAVWSQSSSLIAVQQFDRSPEVWSQSSSLIAVQQFDRSP